MINVEKSASAHLPAAGVWLQRGKGLARAAAAAVRGISGWVRRGFLALVRVHARSIALRELSALDNRLLQDIGLRRDQLGATVDAMFQGEPVAEATQPPREVEAGDIFQGEPVAEATQPSREVEAGDIGDVTELNANNDRHYRSAA
jgi:uncharacterized protein YjiS (DUF1127 family)